MSTLLNYDIIQIWIIERGFSIVASRLNHGYKSKIGQSNLVFYFDISIQDFSLYSLFYYTELISMRVLYSLRNTYKGAYGIDIN